MVLPLVVFDHRLGDLDFAKAEMLSPDDLPSPYHDLLVHTEHMTVTVEDFFHDPVEVEVLQSAADGQLYHRKILLRLNQSRKVVQFGLVRIDLSCLPEAVSKAIVGEKIPLGRVLIEHNVLRRVQPTAFVRLAPEATMQMWFDMANPEPLYGRTGVIFCNDRPAIAVLEVLAPINS